MKTPHKHAVLIKAWADGATIEYENSRGLWMSSHHPSWDSANDYRIKPADKFQVLAYKSVECGDGFYENRLTFQLDPAATQWALGRTDGEGDRLFLFETRTDADDACRAVNKSLTNF